MMHSSDFVMGELVPDGLAVRMLSRPLLSQPVVSAVFAAARLTRGGSARADIYCGWGRKATGLRAQSLARRYNAECWLLEDGFLRSVERADPALSMVIDDHGIFYDASVPSRLEQLIPVPIDAAEYWRACNIQQQWCQAGVSKYNDAPEFSGVLPENYVLVLDQVCGDASISYGRASAASFQHMLAAALAENPDSTVVVKVHPDAYTRGKVGHFDPRQLATMPRVVVIAENCHLVRLLDAAQAVYVVTSQVGFEALLRHKTVRCFGMPFYAGWGLTIDEQTLEGRRGHASLAQLIHAALVRYSVYMDPFTQQLCEIETIIEYVRMQRSMRCRFALYGDLAATGFSRWKRPVLSAFLRGHPLTFFSDPSSVLVNQGAMTPVVWGSDRGAGLQRSLIRVEDGFLRSSGLGADLITPLSWVFDDLGMYYDARTVSRLEYILSSQDFDDSLLERAMNLRARIVSEGVSKYNLAGSRWSRPANAARVVLVPGQVENDASLRFGGCGITTNLALLQAVREQCPDAWIVYKPHPDVVSGLRRGDIDSAAYQALADEIVLNGESTQMLAEVDEVHTMTSLLGFEALLRNRNVVCYGHPFYSGWGLTTDVTPIPRRTARRTLDELVAAALILYPVYVSRKTGSYCSPEQAVNELIEWKQAGPSRMPIWRRLLRVVLRLWAASGLRKYA